MSFVEYVLELPALNQLSVLVPFLSQLLQRQSLQLLSQVVVPAASLWLRLRGHVGLLLVFGLLLLVLQHREHVLVFGQEPAFANALHIHRGLRLSQYRDVVAFEDVANRVLLVDLLPGHKIVHRLELSVVVVVADQDWSQNRFFLYPLLHIHLFYLLLLLHLRLSLLLFLDLQPALCLCLNLFINFSRFFILLFLLFFVSFHFFFDLLFYLLFDLFHLFHYHFFLRGFFGLDSFTLYAQLHIIKCKRKSISPSQRPRTSETTARKATTRSSSVDASPDQQFEKGKYTVRQKLGWGHFSTVWLVETQDHQYFAMKVQRSKPSHAETALDELRLLTCIRSSQQSEEWRSFATAFQDRRRTGYGLDCKCIYHLDHFSHFGPFGKHYCLTFQILGPNLLDLIQHYEFKDLRMPISIVKSVSRQMLFGLVFLHEVAKMIHTDLKPENVMIEVDPDHKHQFIQLLKQYKKKPLSMKYLKTRHSVSKKNRKKYEKKKLKKAGLAVPSGQSAEPLESKEEDQISKGDNHENDKKQMAFQKETPQSICHKPFKAELEQKGEGGSVREINRKKYKYAEGAQLDVQHLQWKSVKLPISESMQFKIVDFGNACWQNQKFTEHIQTREYRAPEVIIEAQYDEKADIWSLACIIYQLLTCEYLFKPRTEHSCSKNMHHINLMQQVLGKFGKDFALSGKRSREFFNKRGEAVYSLSLPPTSVAERLEQFGLSKEESRQVESFLCPMLRLDPAERTSAREALEHPWLWQ